MTVLSSYDPPSASSAPTEDYSHGALTACFPLTLGLEGQVFTPADMVAFGKTVTNGFARLDSGVLFDTVNGTATNQGWLIVRTSSGYYLRVAPYYPEAYDRIADFMLQYQNSPFCSDIGALVRFHPSNVWVMVPGVVGISQAAAEAAITGVDLTVGVISPVHSATVPAGYVISQTPLEGTGVLIDTAVDMGGITGADSGDCRRSER